MINNDALGSGESEKEQLYCDYRAFFVGLVVIGLVARTRRATLDRKNFQRSRLVFVLESGGVRSLFQGPHKKKSILNQCD